MPGRARFNATNPVDDGLDIRALQMGQVSAMAGIAATRAIECAALACLNGQASAMVTAPIHKLALQAAGVQYGTCKSCNGQGQVLKITNTILGRMQTSALCSSCGGSGQTLLNRPPGTDPNGMIKKEETVSIKIPAGVEGGMQLKVSGKGNEAPANGISGDLLVLIEEIPHDVFVREGNHLHYDLYVSISEAALGVSKELNLLDGKARIKLEPGIQSGKTLRLRGKGLASVNGYGTGDLLVHINVWTPKKLNKEQEQFFEKMLEDSNFKPSPEKTDKSFFEKVKDMFA
jgi:molecular chaperone DnaJ